MNNPPAFQFYAQDFLTGVMYLTNEEVGMYVRMLCKQWTDGKIPKKRLGLLVGMEWDKFSDELKSKFIDEGEYLINLRLEKEREKKARFIEKQRKNGRLGGRPLKNPSLNPNKSQKKPLEDEVEIEDSSKEGKGGVGEKETYPTMEAFIRYALSKKSDVNIDGVKLKYESWVENGWKTGGKNGHKIKNWKSTLLNTLPYIKEKSSGQKESAGEIAKRMIYASSKD